MPSLVDFQFLSGAGVLIGLIITAALIVLIADWRLALFALTLQYVLLALLLTSFVQPAVATVRVIAGGLAGAILYITQRHVAEENLNVRASAATVTPLNPQVFIVGFPFRFFAVALVAVSIIGIAGSMAFLGLPTHVFFSSLWLIAIGLLVAMLSRDALRLGLGILVFTGGFSVLDTAIEGSLFLYGLLNVADLLIALVIAHLVTLPHEAEYHYRRGETP